MSELRDRLEPVYRAISEGWLSPQDVDPGSRRLDVQTAADGILDVEPGGASLLYRFLESEVDEDRYVELFELDPRCPLYLGSHVFEEPRSCANSGVSDRNGYMIELLGAYRHFGFAPNGTEMPDYLPMVVEVLALTAGSPDPVRRKLVEEYLLPYLPPLRERLAGLDTPHIHLLDALDRVLRFDLASTPTAEPKKPAGDPRLPILETSHG